MIGELVAWDAHCETYLPADEIGNACPNGMCPECLTVHHLRKRRAFICPVCRDCYFDYTAFIHHVEAQMGEHESEAI